MSRYESHNYDVIVIGAGGAGLRAAVEVQERGLRVAVICKSLLGKAHTVMAEGGVAAAMGNVYPEDNWQVHFRDTLSWVFLSLAWVVYARVSSSDQKADLDGQVARVVERLNKEGLPVVRTVTEVGSGLNGHRPKLIALLKDPQVQVVAVEHRDRLMRFGPEYVEAALAPSGKRLLVVEPTVASTRSWRTLPA